MREAEEERVAVVQAGSDEAVNKDGGSLGGKGGTETIDVSKMEIGRPGYVVDV